MNPRSGRYAGGSIEVALLSAATIEMGRLYCLPVEAAGMGSTDHQIPSIQGAYEGALNTLPPTLAWPDMVVGPDTLGAMILMHEQLLVDLEVFGMCGWAHQRIAADAGGRLEDVVDLAGPGGTYIGERSTARRARGLIRGLGCRR